MRVIGLLFAFFFLISCHQTNLKLLDKGVSIELAQYRKQQISAITYDLHFRIPNDIKEPIPSTLKVQFHLNAVDGDQYLDFNVATENLKSVQINGTDTPIDHQNEHIILTEDLLKTGKNEVQISFDAGETSLNRNKEFLYTLLVPKPWN